MIDLTDKDKNHWETLESDLRATDKKVSAIEAQLNSLTTNVSQLATDFREFTRMASARWNEANKTNWGPILTVIGIMGSILVVFVTMNINPVNEKTLNNSDDIESIRNQVTLYQRESEYYRGVIETTQKFHRDMIDALDTTLQREMRLLDDMLQREIALNKESVLEKTQVLHSAITNLERDIDNIQSSRYTSEDAKRDQEHFNRKLDIVRNKRD